LKIALAKGRCHAPRTPRRLALGEGEARLEHADAVLHQEHRQRVHQVAVDEIHVAADALDFGDHALGREARILRAGEEEVLEAHHVEAVGRHAEQQFGLALRGLAHGVGVAHRAVQEYAVHALHAPLGHAHRQVLVLLVEQAQRPVAVAGQLVGAQARQRLPDPVRKARLALAAERAVLEVLGDIVVDHRPVATEARPQIDRGGGQQQDQQRRELSAPAAQHAAPAWERGKLAFGIRLHARLVVRSRLQFKHGRRFS
jgi:hypothetical protein